MNKSFWIVATLSLLCTAAFSQSRALEKTYAVTDTTNVVADGLSMGYSVKSATEKEVGSKGEFSRYSLQFHVTNISPEAKIFLYNQGWQVGNDVSPYVVQFDCLNATGARFTSKRVQLQLAACTILAVVEDKDHDNKITKNKRFVQVGYWIKPNETIKTDAIMIVPLNELPNMQVTLYPNMNANIIGNATIVNQPSVTGNISAAGSFDPDHLTGDFFKIRNSWNNDYINNQQGPLYCSAINNEWWSAQWKFVRVSGGYFLIKNKWKGSLISTENSELLSENYNSNAAWWIIERVPNSNLIRFRNVAIGTYLNLEHGRLESGNINNDAKSINWIVE